MTITLEIIIAFISAAGFGGVSVAVVTYFLEQKKVLVTNTRNRKEEQYKAFLENIIAFFTGWEDEDRKKKFMEELYTHAPLYASSKVIKIANDFLASQSTDKKSKFNKDNSDNLYKKLVLEIRKDMGLNNGIFNNLTDKDIKIYKLD